MDSLNIRDFLTRTELFEDLSQQELELILPHCTVQTFEQGDIIFTEATPIQELILIKRGSIQVYSRENGTDQSLTIFSTFEFLNENMLVNQDQHHLVSARAYTSVTLITIPRRDILGIMANHGSMAVSIYARIARIVSRRMEHANYRTKNVASLYQPREMRREHDLLGERDVPERAYYGIQTMRATENFAGNGVLLNFYPELVRSLAVIKQAAAWANYDQGVLSQPLRDAISQACDEIRHGMLHNHFIADLIQGGAGTSTNMNANEVIANRALEILEHPRGAYEHCHPNTHVNCSQSTNDVYPTAVKLALMTINEALIEDLQELITELEGKAAAFTDVIKMGRTQLQDAVPMTLGQSFAAYATTLREETHRLEESSRAFLRINMGGTAIGTGITAAPGYSKSVVPHLRRLTGRDLELADDLIEATHDTGAFVLYSSALKRLAVKLSKICNDLRLLSSGPRTGLNEINLPPVQPGSSIMPGKVNPVIPELVNQIAFKVIGNDLTVTMAAEAGQLELNVMEPVITESLFESADLLCSAMSRLNRLCIRGITANRDVCRRGVENSIGLVTALTPYLGYEQSSAIAREALEKGARIYDLVLGKELLPREKLDALLSPENMLAPAQRPGTSRR
ncbi:MAG: aspartate ammonia-lyase [Fibrobacterota bacterium]